MLHLKSNDYSYRASKRCGASPRAETAHAWHITGIELHFSDRDRRDLYIRGQAGRSSADRTVRRTSEA